MQKLKHITGFYFGSARYHLDDGAGDRIVLVVDYWHNKFYIRSKTKTVNSHFREEIKIVAAGLLSRKHRVNFVPHLNSQ